MFSNCYDSNLHHSQLSTCRYPIHYYISHFFLLVLMHKCIFHNKMVEDVGIRFILSVVIVIITLDTKKHHGLQTITILILRMLCLATAMIWIWTTLDTLYELLNNEIAYHSFGRWKSVLEHVWQSLHQIIKNSHMPINM